MKKNIVFVLLIISVIVLSYRVDSIEFILLVFSLLTLIFMIIIGVINVFKRINANLYKVSAILVGICWLGIFVSLFKPYKNPILESGNINEKLNYAYTTDQNDRKQLKSYIKLFSKLNERDSVRLKQVNEFYEHDHILEPIDKFYAAFIYHHSNESKDYKIASELAGDAAKEEILKDNYQVQWLRKASYDRWQLSKGEPEKYNTQNSFSIELTK